MINTIMDKDKASFYMYNRNIKSGRLSKNGESLGVVSEIIGEDPELEYLSVLKYIEENPECGIYAWKVTVLDPKGDIELSVDSKDI